MELEGWQMLSYCTNSCVSNVEGDLQWGLAQRMGRMNVEVSRLKKSRGKTLKLEAKQNTEQIPARRKFTDEPIISQVNICEMIRT